MQQKSYDCTLITPMFSGDDTWRNVALRAPSFKGAMRFWWRAVQRLTAGGSLRDHESKIFGSSNEAIGRSKVILRTKYKELSIGQANPLPHHRNGWCSDDEVHGCSFKKKRCQKAIPRPCFSSGGKFEVILSSRNIDSFTIAQNTFQLSSILGGIGRRSRRGFGSYFLDCHNASTDLNEEVTTLLNALLPDDNPAYQIQDITINGKSYKNVIMAPSPTAIADYPQIKYVVIHQTSKSSEEIVRIIGEASHNNPSDDLGAGRRNYRLASPVYFSLYKANNNDYLITTLLSSTKDVSIQEQMIDEVISNV